MKPSGSCGPWTETPSPPTSVFGKGPEVQISHVEPSRLSFRYRPGTRLLFGCESLVILRTLCIQYPTSPSSRTEGNLPTGPFPHRIEEQFWRWVPQDTDYYGLFSLRPCHSHYSPTGGSRSSFEPLPQWREG